METCIINTPLGYTKITGNNKGITAIVILNTKERVSEVIPKVLENCVNQLNAYFSGTLKTFCLKLNPKGTDFQKKVWTKLQHIPYGKTVSYLQLAHTIGNEKAIRAVANANGKNPLWIVIPCHRVIGSNGKLTGYAGGLYKKQWLLEHENSSKQQRLF